MNLELILMSENDIAEFKKNVQCAFQKGFEDVFGKCEETILPEKDIDQSLNGKGSVAYKAVLDGETVGGVIVAIDTETQHNHLDLLYVKSGVQGKGIGKSIWYAVEKLYQLHPSQKSNRPVSTHPHALYFNHIHFVKTAMYTSIPFINQFLIKEIFRINSIRIELFTF